MYACVYAAGYDDDHRGARRATLSGSPGGGPARSALQELAQQFSPRYETRGDLVVIDVRGLERLFGDARAIGDELRRDAADRGLRVHVAVAATMTAAMVMAIARPGVTVVEPGCEAAAIAPESLDIVCTTSLVRGALHSGPPSDGDPARIALQVKRWGVNTLGEFAALPADGLASRLGPQGLAWQAMARGLDVRPLVPDVEDERFEASLELEWPIEGLEPLSFVLTRLLEPLSLRLERRDRGAAVLHVALRLVTKETHARRLELPTPMRDVKALRTLALLDLEAHLPGASGEHVGVDRVEVVIDPTPARVWQHTLFAHPHPTPEQLSTLLARLGAVMGQDRVGAPVTVDSYRPGAFAMKPFATEHGDARRDRKAALSAAPQGGPERPALHDGSLRRCRQPVPARVTADASGRPATVTTDRRGFAGGAVVRADGPWKTSGEWWAGGAGQAGWDRDEWDVALSDGGLYRVFLDRVTRRWFIDAIVD